MAATLKLKLARIAPSTRRDKKWMAAFDDGTVTHFGARGHADYTTHRDKDRKKRYITRHGAAEDWTDPRSAGTLARYVLWNKKTVVESVRDFKERFGL